MHPAMKKIDGVFRESGRPLESIGGIGTPQSTIRVPHKESQMINPTQQLSGSALALQLCFLFEMRYGRNALSHETGAESGNRDDA